MKRFALLLTVQFLAFVSTSFCFAVASNSEQSKNIQGVRRCSTKLLLQMYRSSQLIFIGEYMGCKMLQEPTKQNQVIASFKYVDVLKGPWLGSEPRVLYKLPNLNSQGTMKSTVSPTALPKPNSKWILFISKVDPIDGPWVTNCGAIGRVKCTEENLNRFYDIKAKSRPANMHKGRLALRNGDSYVVFDPDDNKPSVDLVPRDPKFKSDIALFQRMYNESKSVVIAEFVSFKKVKNDTKSGVPIAVFKRFEYLKGMRLKSGDRIPVLYFQAQRGRETANSELSSASERPKVGSKWILYFPNLRLDNGAYKTYEGALGRVPFNGWTRELTLRVIEQIKGSTGYRSK